MTEEYITQVSEEIEGRVAKKLSQEFSRTKSRILGAFSKPDEFLLNPQVRKTRKNDSQNQQLTGDRSLYDPYPELEFSVLQASTSADSDREESSHKNSFSQKFEKRPLRIGGSEQDQRKLSLIFEKSRRLPKVIRVGCLPNIHGFWPHIKLFPYAIYLKLFNTAIRHVV